MERLLELLFSIVGEYEHTRGDNYIFHCPFCNHHKKKLEINISSERYHCWVCHTKGRTMNSLFKKLKTSSSNFEKLFSIVGKRYSVEAEKESYGLVSLPKEYSPLWNIKKDPDFKNAYLYCMSRGLSSKDILRYRIGYCDSGEYRKRLIFPSYSFDGTLNYFIARSYIDSSFPYKYPKVPRDSIIFNELFINWSLPVILVEGFLDAATIKRNCIPLLGTTIGNKLISTIIEKKVTDVYIALDPDARIQAINITERLINEGINVYFINLEDKDPNALGFEKINKQIKSTNSLTLSDLIKYKWSV